jgi:hypothetical protein
MLFGRLIGWALVALAVVMASADAVMALGPVEYAGIITADVVTLLAGHTPEASEMAPSLIDSLRSALLDMPAWVAVGAMGLSLSLACRKRVRQRRYFRHR